MNGIILLIFPQFYNNALLLIQWEILICVNIFSNFHHWCCGHGAHVLLPLGHNVGHWPSWSLITHCPLLSSAAQETGHNWTLTQWTLHLTLTAAGQSHAASPPPPPNTLLLQLLQPTITTEWHQSFYNCFYIVADDCWRSVVMRDAIRDCEEYPVRLQPGDRCCSSDSCL